MPLNDRVFDMPDLEFLQVRARRRLENTIQEMREARRRFEEEPSFEERKERCELMGMVFCTCTRVHTGEGETVIHDPKCKVCNQFVTLR